MERTFDKRYRGDHPMFDATETCELCKQPAQDDLHEYGNALICSKCLQKFRDEAWEQEERRREAGQRYDLMRRRWEGK